MMRWTGCILLIGPLYEMIAIIGSSWFGTTSCGGSRVLTDRGLAGNIGRRDEEATVPHRGVHSVYKVAPAML